MNRSLRAPGLPPVLVALAVLVVLADATLVTGAVLGDRAGPIRDAVRTVTTATGTAFGGSGGDAPGEADGRIGDREVTIDDDVPAVTRLDPELRAAVRAASRAAEADGIAVHLTSGWRSEHYQQSLLDEAVATYGSREEASRWVASPTTSAHVTGDAVDVGPTDAAYWFSQHGARFGLCQVYGNEIWHYELRDTTDGTCPPPLADGAAAG